MAKHRDEPAYEGGSQPVPERAPEVPTAGRGVARTVAVVVGALALLAALLWLLVPMLAA